MTDTLPYRRQGMTQRERKGCQDGGRFPDRWLGDMITACGMTCRNLILGGVCNELTKSILGCADHRAAGAYAGRMGRYLAGDIQSTDGIAENGRRVQANGRADLESSVSAAADRYDHGF